MQTFTATYINNGFQAEPSHTSSQTAAPSVQTATSHSRVRTKKGTYHQRINASTVRVTLGNEITEYHLDEREEENLLEMDFQGWTPLHTYFGRFKDDLFTGIKYNYGYALGKERVGKYVESIVEYRNGRMAGEQLFFNTEGDVTRRIYIEDAPAARLDVRSI